MIKSELNLIIIFKKSFFEGANLFAEFCLLAVASALAAHEVIKYKERDREEEERLNSENQELSEVVETMKRILEQQNRNILTLTELIKTYRRSLDMVSLDRETEMYLQAEVRTQSNMAGTNIPFNNVR